MSDERDERRARTAPPHIAQQIAGEPRSDRSLTPVGGAEILPRIKNDTAAIVMENAKQTSALDDIRGRVDSMERRQNDMDSRMSMFVGQLTERSENLNRELTGIRTESSVNAFKIDRLLREAEEADKERAERRRMREAREVRENDVVKTQLALGSKRALAWIGIVGAIATAAITGLITALASR